MATQTPQKFIGLAKALPNPLQRFFARWPPAAIVPEGQAPTEYQQLRPNPFANHKNPVTGKWQDPVYSLRRQAELCKMAREHGVEHLLPESRKGFETKLAKRVEHGLKVKGTGVGQSVKGHIHERTMIAKYVVYILRLWWMCADDMQDGEKERGHAGHAQAHQALEEGMS
jgi:large subunit ribosomal protein L25